MASSGGPGVASSAVASSSVSPPSLVPSSSVVPPGPSGSSRTFAEALASSLLPPVVNAPVHEPALTDSGEPAVFFSGEELAASMVPFAFALVARTIQGRPAFPDIRAHLHNRCRLKDDFVISALDSKHLLLRFRNQDDYLQLLLREHLYVHGRLFRFFKWSMQFSPNADSSVLPVWISFPGLPANLFVEPMIRSIAGNIGKVLKIDPSTLNLSNTVAARVCVELDVTQSHPHRLWVGFPGGGAWQDILYPELPLFCSHCSRLGHSLNECKGKSIKPVENQDLPQVIQRNPPRVKNIWKQVALQTTGVKRNTGGVEPPPKLSFSQDNFVTEANKAACTHNEDSMVEEIVNQDRTLSLQKDDNIQRPHTEPSQISAAQLDDNPLPSSSVGSPRRNPSSHFENIVDSITELPSAHQV